MKLHRIGEVNFNRNGSKMILETYNRADNIWVRFIDSDNLVHTTYQAFKNGQVKNPYDRSVYRVGYLGEGNYVPTINGNYTKQYRSWQSMLQRCYDSNFHKKQPRYSDCVVDESWHNFQTFAKWFDNNYYEINGEQMALDKDALVKGNKIYSSETCVFVTPYINSLFVKGNKKRGNLPIGVSMDKESKSYQSFCGNKGELIYLGSYDTIEKAYQSYKEYKEQLIKKVANEYIDKIPYILYEAMMKYEVEFDD